MTHTTSDVYETVSDAYDAPARWPESPGTATKPDKNHQTNLVVVILCASVPDTGSDAYDTASDAYDTASDTRLMCMTHTVRYASDMYQTCITKMSDVYDTGKTR